MRTPEEYIADMLVDAEHEELFNLPAHTSAHYDQLTQNIREAAKTVGLNTDSVGFKASFLFAADFVDHLVASLKESEQEDKETGALYLEEAARRLRLISLWGEDRCHKTDCLDLR